MARPSASSGSAGRPSVCRCLHPPASSAFVRCCAGRPSICRCLHHRIDLVMSDRHHASLGPGGGFLRSIGQGGSNSKGFGARASGAQWPKVTFQAASRCLDCVFVAATPSRWVRLWRATPCLRPGQDHSTQAEVSWPAFLVWRSVPPQKAMHPGVPLRRAPPSPLLALVGQLVPPVV